MGCLPAIRKILIANRGEIAIRIARTARAMGIGPAMIYSENDRDAPHTRAGDEAISIGDSYLDIERVIDAAHKLNADAIHPGYGFLSENADFAQACARAGLTFIGPSPDVIRKMGLKKTAREIAASAGVPVVPAFDAGAAMQFPVLIKASAGGGGRGMRIVTEPAQFEEAFRSARSEAERSFGDGSLIIERYVEGARHIEFQIFGDAHGTLIHLFERDCSIQRRHQKIIEECPSPALNDDLRRQMGEAALTLARAIGYANAGTVEFLLAPSGEFYFIEVNTRIQVEHSVTELVTGLDLIRLQIEVAEGKRLPPNPRLLGHAIEARLYAEDPANDFLPSTGVVHQWRAPENVRVDTALESGLEIGIHYDPLLAKIVSYGTDRETALRKLQYALKSTCLLGIQTNREYLIQILESAVFREGDAHTGFLPKPHADSTDESEHIAAANLYLERSQKHLLKIPPNYRNNPYRPPSRRIRIRDQEIAVSWTHRGSDLYEVQCGARTHACRVHTRVNAANQITLTIDNITRVFEIARSHDQVFIQTPDTSTTIQLLPPPPPPNSPMPGQILRILVHEGQQVKTGDSLVVVEAMKMEQTIRTTINGVVHSVLVKAGELVAPGQMLVQINAEETSQ
jgi:propionyl-CoA carboxylase alpha chain